jgi:hypothetical protein
MQQRLSGSVILKLKKLSEMVESDLLALKEFLE